MKQPRAIILSMLAIGISGCAATAIEQNGAFIDHYAKQNIGAAATWHKNSRDRAAARELADRLLEQPLAADDAVRLALALSPAFQVMMADTAAASAAATQSARLSNPIFTFERLVRRESGGVDLDIGRMLSVSLLELIYLPSRRETAASLQTQARLRGAASVVETATNTRRAWVNAVATQQSLVYSEQVMEAAEASAELAKRMYQVGNFSKLQRARQQVFYADAVTQLAKAKQSAVASREALIRTLGLDSVLAEKLKLPARLPDLPAQPKLEGVVAQRAISQRLDVQMAATELGMLASKYGYTKATSYVNAFHLAGVRNSETGKPPQRGYELELAIPLFDWGDATRGEAHAQYMAATQRVIQTGIDAESGIREQYAAWRTAYDLSLHHRNEIVPLRKAIAEEVLLKYNGMLLGVFDLLADTRAQISSVIQAIDAERDFWLADAALQAAMLGKPMGMSMMSGAATPMNDAGAGH